MTNPTFALPEPLLQEAVLHTVHGAFSAYKAQLFKLRLLLIGVGSAVLLTWVPVTPRRSQHSPVWASSINMINRFQSIPSASPRFQPLSAARAGSNHFQSLRIASPERPFGMGAVRAPLAARDAAVTWATNVDSKITAASTWTDMKETDVVIIGSGIAGLSCGAILAHLGYDVTVLESHSEVGGAAHTWERQGFHFESGPSLYSGLSMDESANPLKNIFQIIGEEPEWLTYERWGTFLPEGNFSTRIGPGGLDEVITRYGGPGAIEQWKKITKRMAPIGDAAQGTPSIALREDLGAVVTLGKYPGELLNTLSKGPELTQPFSKIFKELKIDNKFVINWLDLLCFLLQGCPASGTMNTVIGYMLKDWYRPGVVLDFPKGGSGGIVAALRRGIEKSGRIITSAHVEEILVDDDAAVGVRLRGSKETKIYARKAIVSNADPQVTLGLLETNLATHKSWKAEKAADYLKGMLNDFQDLNSFIHLHAGIDGAGLPTKPSAELPMQWAVVYDWNKEGGGVEAPRNVVLVSMPSLLDPSLAPKGKHVIHAYTPATEPYANWAGMDRQSKEYKQKKAEAEDFLWKAVERAVPDARNRSEITMVGTPLTHQRFLRRKSGTYGPRVVAGKQILPGHKTPLERLFITGDFTFPGIGIPATAASGAITATSIADVSEHLSLLDKIRLPKNSN